MIEVKDISTDNNLKNQFIKIGADFSKRPGHGIPKFESSEKALINPEKNFFFKQGGIFKGFLALENENPVGRVAATINPEMYFEEGKLGMLGMFECEDNYKIAEKLLNAGKEFLKQQNCTRIWGPMEFSIWHNYRYITDNFNSKPFLGESRNPEYYPAFFKRYGFVEKYNWQSRILDKPGIKKVLDKFQPQIEIFNSLDYEFIFINKNNEQELMQSAYDLFMDSYKVFDGFSQVSRADFLSYFDYVPRILDRKASVFLKSPQGEIVAFLLVVKDLTKALTAMQGKTDILAKLKFKMNEGNSEYANLYQGGASIKGIREAMTLGKEKLRKPLSLGRVGIAKAFEHIYNSPKYKYAIFPLMREDAPNKNYSEGIYKTARNYFLYELEL